MPTICLVRLLANAKGPEINLSANVSRVEFSLFQDIVRPLFQELNVDGRSQTSDIAVKYRTVRQKNLELIVQRFHDIALLPESAEQARVRILDTWLGVSIRRVALEFECMHQDHLEVCQLMMIHTLPPIDD